MSKPNHLVGNRCHQINGTALRVSGCEDDSSHCEAKMAVCKSAGRLLKEYDSKNVGARTAATVETHAEQRRATGLSREEAGVDAYAYVC